MWSGESCPLNPDGGNTMLLGSISKRVQQFTASDLRRLPSELHTCNKNPRLLFIVGLSLFFSEPRNFCFLCIVREDNLLVS